MSKSERIIYLACVNDYVISAHESKEEALRVATVYAEERNRGRDFPSYNPNTVQIPLYLQESA